MGAHMGFRNVPDAVLFRLGRRFDIYVTHPFFEGIQL